MSAYDDVGVPSGGDELATDVERQAVAADADRAGMWLRGLLDEEHVRASLRAATSAALGLAIRGLLAPSAAAEHDARYGAVLTGELLERTPDGEAPACDPLALALVYALHTGARAHGTHALSRAVRARARAIRDAAASAARRDLIAALLGDVLSESPASEAARAAVRCDAAAYETALFAPQADVEALCDAVEAYGLDVSPSSGAAARRELGLALAARAFSAARTFAGYGFAMRIARVVAARRLDADAVRELVRVARTIQRVDGSFAHVPVRDRGGNDLRAAVHVSYTLASLWTMHDACTHAGLVSAAKFNSQRD